MISVSPSVSTTVTIGNNFPIRIAIIRGEANVSLTRNGNSLDLNRSGKSFVHVISNVNALSNGTYIAIGDNDVGYHQIQFSLFAFCKHYAI